MTATERTRVPDYPYWLVYIRCWLCNRRWEQDWTPVGKRGTGEVPKRRGRPQGVPSHMNPVTT